MYVVEVIPLVRDSRVETLTYYSSIEYKQGALVNIPVRKKEAAALVVNSQPVSAARTAVRAATFSLRKLPEQTTDNNLPPLLIKVAKKITTQLPTTLGAALFALLPEEVRSGKELLDAKACSNETAGINEVSVLTGPLEERLRTYRSQIRGAFAHRGSVLLVVPTAAHVTRMEEELSTGINERVVTFSPEYSPKKLHKSYEGLYDLSVSKLIITTPAHAFVDRHDITHIIVEGSRSPYYKARKRPYLDTRDTLIWSAKEAGRKVILGDLVPRTEDEYKRREEIYSTEGEHPKRIAFDSSVKVLTQTDKPTSDAPFQLFSKNLLEDIQDTIAERRNVFLYAARRGLSPVVVCRDCGYIFRCPDSGAPYSLFRTVKNGEEQRWFLSGTSGRRIKAADVCAACGGWRIAERGIGIQQVYDELKKHFDSDQIFVFDHTTATTQRKIRQIIGGFYGSKGAILLGTAMTLPYLEEPISLSAVMSLDAARAIPTWRSDEEIFSLLLGLREVTTDTLYIQTRTEPDAVIEAVKRGQLDAFYDEELTLRESLNYPPFAYFVHLTIQGAVKDLQVLEAEMAKHLEAFKVAFYSAPDSVPGRTTRYGLIRVRSGEWPKPELLAALRALPPSVRIEINPARIV